MPHTFVLPRLFLKGIDCKNAGEHLRRPRAAVPSTSYLTRGKRRNVTSSAAFGLYRNSELAFV